MKLGKALIQTGPSGFRTRHLVGEDEVLVDAKSDERINLKAEVLVVCANARVSYQTPV